MCISSFSSGGADLVSCGGSGVVRLRNAAHSRLEWGKYLFTADRQGTLKTWDIQVVSHTSYTVYCLSAAVNRTNAHWNYMPPWHFCILWESQERMAWKWQRRREWWGLVNTEPKEIKRQTVGDCVNLDISIRSGMLFTLEMTALSVILKPLLPPSTTRPVSHLENPQVDILAEAMSPSCFGILNFSGSLNEGEEFALSVCWKKMRRIKPLKTKIKWSFQPRELIRDSFKHMNTQHTEHMFSWRVCDTSERPFDFLTPIIKT